MDESENPTSTKQLIAAVCHELLRLAHLEDDRAAAEAARTPYWMPTPEGVLGHRAAASALRADAERFELILRAG